ncbi:hypothetical protein Tco_0151813 [Tanacetum coccineum]
MVKPAWNSTQRVNHKNFAKKTHPCAKKNMVPRAILMKSGLVSVNTARQVNAAHTKTTVNVARPMSYLSKKIHSTDKRPIHKNTTFKNSNFNQKVNTVKDKNVNTVRPKEVVNAARLKAVIQVSNGGSHKDLIFLPYGHAIQNKLQEKGVIDSGCSRRMTRNMYKSICGCSPKSSPDAGFKPSSDDEKKVNDDPRTESEREDIEKEDNVNNTNKVNTISSIMPNITNNVNAANTNEVNDVGAKTSIELPDDLNMPDLEEIVPIDNY